MDNIDVEHFCNEYVLKIRWRIDNFSTKISRNDKKASLDSPYFNFYKSRTTFHLDLQSDTKNKDELSLTLFSSNVDYEKPINLNLKFYIEDSKGICIKDFPGWQNFFFQILLKFLERIVTFYRFSLACGDRFKPSELYSPENKVINEDDIVYICCEIKRNTSQADFKPFKLDGNFASNLYEAHQFGGNVMCEIKIDDEVGITVLFFKKVNMIFIFRWTKVFSSHIPKFLLQCCKLIIKKERQM